ncbi:DNA polymerase III beta subunit-like protein [Kitasatospora sp. SolWspMP-SS2h]|uniref:hypothetical protein n=1 Tax=Kitasatospora sp. SolWspMP-SS2h TaxID=1305729 RepID=UPI000DB91326|nr:hypothetical protein [Kitasatospora sp. SolWspMP-SS2h]RAJ42806.1 DNA polymerase III beta subunit-like protein [Kitasatospora sp. SolWspMP-SS2h]
MPVTLPDLPGIIRRLAPHISTDTTLPSINGIYLEATGTHLFACATDRYTFALTRHETPDDTANGPWRALIAKSDLTALKALFTCRRHRTEHTLTYEQAWPGAETWLSVSDGDRALQLSAHAEEASHFPKWRHLFADALAAEPQLTQEAHYSADFLARWHHAPAERHEPLTLWSAGPDKPLLIAAGHDFLGLQMPIRLDSSAVDHRDRTHLRTAWTDALTTNPQPARALRAA